MAMQALLDAHPLEQVREGLAKAGLVGPHAYIRGLNGDYDLAMHLERMLRPLACTDDDLRLASRGPDAHWVLMERLPWDSEFFQRGVARLDAVVAPGRKPDLRADVAAPAAALHEALREAARRGIDYVFSTVDAVDLPTIRTLGACGFELIETRCHYHKALTGPPTERHPTRLAVAADVPSLARAATEMVNPFDRFHADPCIPSVDADRLMDRWVHASVLEGFADATVVPDEPAPEAFCTAKYHRDHWDGWGMRLAQPVLSAVSPRHRGWYVRLISELGEHLRTVGAEHAFLITQITNNAVLRCWEKLGYQFGKGEHVFRKILEPQQE